MTNTSGRTVTGETRFVSAQIVVLTIYFMILVGLALAFRDASLVSAVTGIAHLPLKSLGETNLLCGDLPACFRIGMPALQGATNSVIGWLADSFDLLPDRARPEVLSLEVKHAFLAAFGMIVVRMLLLSPILIVAFTTFRGFAVRFIFLTLVFLAICGWARSNPLFSEQIFAPYDFAAIGYLFVLYMLLRRGLSSSLLRSAVVLVSGQIFFEHLGFVAGVSIALYAFATGARPREAIRILAILGAVSLVFAAALYGAIAATAGTLFWVSPGQGFGYTYEFYGRTNFAEFGDILENLVELLAYPILTGLILGLLTAFGIRGANARDAARADWWAAASIFVAFLAATTVGMFVSGLYYEMGRQLVPLSCVTILLVVKGVNFACARYRSA